MTSLTIEDTALTPPMPPMANADIDGLGVIRRLKHNAFEAFPERCWRESIVWLDSPLRPVVIATTAESIRQVMLENHPDYERSLAGKRVWVPSPETGWPPVRERRGAVNGERWHSPSLRKRSKLSRDLSSTLPSTRVCSWRGGVGNR